MYGHRANIHRAKQNRGEHVRHRAFDDSEQIQLERTKDRKLNQPKVPQKFENCLPAWFVQPLHVQVQAELELGSDRGDLLKSRDRLMAHGL